MLSFPSVSGALEIFINAVSELGGGDWCSYCGCKPAPTILNLYYTIISQHRYNL